MSIGLLSRALRVIEGIEVVDKTDGSLGELYAGRSWLGMEIFGGSGVSLRFPARPSN